MEAYFDLRGECPFAPGERRAVRCGTEARKLKVVLTIGVGASRSQKMFPSGSANFAC